MTSENNEKRKRVRVRFAPSPTGIPHVGNIRTALFDYFWAKHNGGDFILRIEDTDQARKVEGAEDAIKESLSWLGASWDEFETQSKRIDEYKKYANQLVEKGFATVESGDAIRFNVPKDGGPIKWKDAIGEKEVSYERESVEDFIILKGDGFPTYHLANVVDDHLMNITHVIRGEDWIPSTPKHILLYEAFKWEMPVFAHVPNVLGKDGKKLSKRHGAKSVLDFKDEGYLSEALLNALMLIGWNPGGDKEFFTKDEIIKKFSLSRVSPSPGIFNLEKLNSMNSHYLRNLSDEDLQKRLLEFDTELLKVENELLSKLVEIAKTRITTLADFRKNIAPFVGLAEKTSDSELKKSVLEKLQEVENWDEDEIFELLRELMKEKEIRLPDIYEAIIGEGRGLPLSAVFEALGKERTLELLK